MKVILTVGFLGLSFLSLAQSLTKNAEGESSVLFKGHNVGIDLGKTQLSLGFNNLNRTIGKRDTFFFGGSIKGENKDGITGLFSKGDFIPSSSADGFFGWSCSNGSIPNQIAQRNKVLSEYANYSNNVLSEFKIDISKAIRLRTEKKELSKLRNELDSCLAACVDFEGFLTNLTIDSVEDSQLTKDAKIKIKSDCDTFIKEFEKTIDAFNDELDQIEEASPKKYFQLLVFGFGGFSGIEFKRFTIIDSSNLSNSFTDQKSRGGKGGLGINLQYGRLTLGITYAYKVTNNFDLLTKKEYSWKSSVSQNSQTLTEEKKITAYAGDYDEVTINEFNFDIVYNFKLDKKAKNHALVNPYIHSQLYSRQSKLLPNSTNIGCGFYFFQKTGKFLGGFYTELFDIENNYEKAKPIMDQNLREPIQRITFGVVAKFSLNSLVELF